MLTLIKYQVETEWENVEYFFLWALFCVLLCTLLLDFYLSETYLVDRAIFSKQNKTTLHSMLLPGMATMLLTRLVSSIKLVISIQELIVFLISTTLPISALWTASVLITATRGDYKYIFIYQLFHHKYILAKKLPHIFDRILYLILYWSYIDPIFDPIFDRILIPKPTKINISFLYLSPASSLCWPVQAQRREPQLQILWFSHQGTKQYIPITLCALFDYSI